MNQNEGIFRHLDPESARAIAILGNAGEMEQIMEKSKNDKEGTIDMCQALQEMMEDARLEGKNEGREDGRREEMENGIRIFIEDNLEEGISPERIREKLTRKYALSEAEARNYLVMHMNEMRQNSASEGDLRQAPLV